MTGLTQELTQSGPTITRVPAVEPVEHRIVRSTTKRAIDVLLAGTGLAVLWPALLLIAVSIVLDSGWPPFHLQERVGLNGRRFRMWKYRTMVRGADGLKAQLAHLNEAPFPAFKVRDDPRITRVGRALRRTSADELPQLWNVLKGDMSLVGPRPPLAAEVEHYDERARRRLSVRPGITCFWQVEDRHANGATFAAWVERDLAYIDRWSLWLDLVLLYRTACVVLKLTGC